MRINPLAQIPALMADKRTLSHPSTLTTGELSLFLRGLGTLVDRGHGDDEHMARLVANVKDMHSERVDADARAAVAQQRVEDATVAPSETDPSTCPDPLSDGNLE